ncbi:MAG: DNA alkylation repair protein [Saprospiraceae bacterium]
MTTQQVIKKLHQLADPEKVKFKAKKFGIISNNSIGVYHKDLKELAKEIGRDNELAIELFDTDIYEARLLCSKIFNPKDVTIPLMEKWVVTFENWEVTDSFCMGLFAKCKHAVIKVREWTKREPEFEKRSGFAIMAAYCMADKKAGNEVYESFLPIIKREATDERIYVKKAVNWSLRSIGKRNIDLNEKAIETAKEILHIDSKAAQWIAKDVLRELDGERINILGYPRSTYRPF